MLLHIPDYINLLMALGNKHFNSPSIKYTTNSQRSRFDTRRRKLISAFL